MDLLDWFRGRHPWPQLLRLLRRLPEHSQYQLAISDCDELYADVEPAPKRRRPPLQAWSAERELLATLHDVASLIQVAIVAVNTPKGKKAPSFKAVPRPETAADRARRRREQQTHAEIVEMFKPRE